MDLVTPRSMNAMDRKTIDEVGVPGPILMDRAARGAVDVLLERLSPKRSDPIGIVCGTGNNGGDGLAMATMLHHLGFDPRILLLGDPSRLAPDAELYFQICRSLELPISLAAGKEAVDQALSSLESCTILVDAIFGTGLDREVTGHYADAIDWLHRHQAPVMAVDLPSGLDGETGQVLGVAADAALTATFGFAKVGQCLDPARQICGDLHIVDIGIPSRVAQAIGFDAVGLDRQWLQDHLPQRPGDTHKGDAGRTLHIGGAPPTCGAIALSARAALVGGAGLITAFTAPRTANALSASQPEIMAVAGFDTDEGILKEKALKDALKACDAAVVGPGLGTDQLAQKLLFLVLDEAPTQLILDADALNLVAEHDQLRDRLTELSGTTSIVLTPHPGEMARLTDQPIASILASPVDHAQKLADDLGATVVLKTAATVVASPGELPAINRTGNPGMATGGMGDALTGLIAAAFADFPAKPHLTSCAAVAVHGLAGDRASLSTGVRGLTVQHLLDESPAVWQSLPG